MSVMVILILHHLMHKCFICLFAKFTFLKQFSLILNDLYLLFINSTNLLLHVYQRQIKLYQMPIILTTILFADFILLLKVFLFIHYALYFLVMKLHECQLFVVWGRLICTLPYRDQMISNNHLLSSTSRHIPSLLKILQFRQPHIHRQRLKFFLELFLMRRHHHWK